MVRLWNEPLIKLSASAFVKTILNSVPRCDERNDEEKRRNSVKSGVSMPKAQNFFSEDKNLKRVTLKC